MRPKDILLKQIKKELKDFSRMNCVHCFSKRWCKGENLEKWKGGKCTEFSQDGKYTNQVAEKIQELALEYTEGKLKLPKNNLKK